jgi:DUF4097 and DUF4098 domain-containing protein YvlB
MRALLLLPAVLLFTGCDFEDFDGMARYHEDFHYNHPLKTGGRLSVEGFNGSVEISSWDQNTVDISGTKSARTPEDANLIRMDIDHTADVVSIRASRPSVRNGNFSVRFMIKVPKGTVYDRITTSNGAIRVYDGAGPARFKSSNGRIELQHIRGGVYAETSNGPIEITDNDGSVEAHSSNGHIKIEGMRGALDATTSNSSIHVVIDRPGDSIRVGSSNGSIDLALPPGAACPVRAHTSNSSITLRLPGTEPNARLSASTSNGNISTDFDMRMRGEISKHHLEGTLGNGGPLIDLETSNGSIHIVK